jgi:hypothetical protein
MKEILPKGAQNCIKQYFNLSLGGKSVPCPYYINIRQVRMGLRVLIGKGSPEEIVQESLIYEKLRNVDFQKMSIAEIRKFLVKRHIGIECSGFVCHVLDAMLRKQKKKHIWKYISFPKASLYRRVARFLRPIENISAQILTNDENTKPVQNLKKIQPGDLIRLKGLQGGYHVILISSVQKEKGNTKKFEYVHATRWYDDQHGVRKGSVEIVDPNKSLSVQRWLDTYKGKNWTYEEIIKDKKYSQVRRLFRVFS